MPELPKLRQKKEANITPLVMEWFAENYPFSVAIEVKVESKLKPHQQVALRQVRDGTFKYKLKDRGDRMPFDFIVIKKDVEPFIVICKKRSCIAYDPEMVEQFDFKV